MEKHANEILKREFLFLEAENGSVNTTDLITKAAGKLQN